MGYCRSVQILKSVIKIMKQNLQNNWIQWISSPFPLHEEPIFFP